MSIYEDLQSCRINDTQKQQITNQLQNFDLLRRILGDCERPHQVLPYLYMELQGANRPSYISRIYGRYRKLIPDRDRALMALWREQNGSPRK